MKTIRFAMGAVWLAVFSGSSQAYVIDWEKSYRTTEIASHTAGVFTNATLLSNYYNWDRSIQLWQSYFNRQETSLTGISLQLQYARWYSMNGTIDLNVYEGAGVQRLLVSSTKLEWNQPFDGGWFGFKLDVPVAMKKDQYYTISLENLISDRALGVVTDDKIVSGAPYMQQGYFGMGSGPRGYITPTNNAGINYILWK